MALELGPLQGIKLPMPQKEDVLLKKYCANASVKIFYGFSIVLFLFYCFGSDAK